MELEVDWEVSRGIVCAKLNGDIHNPGELNGKMIELKEYIKARYKLSDTSPEERKNDKQSLQMDSDGSERKKRPGGG